MKTLRMPALARRTLAASLAATLLAGCAVGPDFHHPAAPKASQYTATPQPTVVGQGADAQRIAAGMDVPREWWTLFRSPELEALIRQALAANPNLAAAQASLRQAQEAALAGRGALFPSVTADYNVERQRVAGTLASPAASGYDYYTLHTAQLEVSWGPDLFGGNRRALEALRAQTDVQRFQMEAARLSLTSNVVVAAINLAGLRAQVDATQKIVANQQQTLASFQRQLQLGQLAPADLAAQQAALAQAQATLPPLQKQLDQQRDALAALLGNAPADAPATHFTLADLHLPATLPLSLPSQLVGHRPDVRAAEAQLHAASAQVGVAEANRLPKFTISANVGSSPTQISELFKHGTVFWNLTGDLAQPLFNAGSLKHQQRAAEAAYDAAQAQYRATVISALQNVADTLYALQADADALTAAQAAEQAAAHSLAINRRQFELGDVSHLAVLQAEQAWQQAEVALVQAQVNRYSDSAALFQALGGGWWQHASDQTAHSH